MTILEELRRLRIEARSLRQKTGNLIHFRNHYRDKSERLHEENERLQTGATGKN